MIVSSTNLETLLNHLKILLEKHYDLHKDRLIEKYHPDTVLNEFIEVNVNINAKGVYDLTSNKQIVQYSFNDCYDEAVKILSKK